MQTPDTDRDNLARVGLVAYGVIHLLLGWLAVQLALGDREGEASTTGAIQQLAQQPFGGVLVWAITVGLFLLALWQAAEAIFDHRSEEKSDQLRNRGSAAAKTVLYIVMGTSAARIAMGSQSGGQEEQANTLTARLLSMPGGQVIVGVVGLVVLGVGGYLIYKGATDKFLEDIAHSGTGNAGTAYTWLGRVGYVAKGIVIGAVGILFGYAAATHDPDEAGGLDQALRQVLEAPGGPVLLGALGVGIAAFGVFCFAWAKHVD
ncbi:DUF1206 domain-containing protein [Nocardioides zeae]|uniref:DUF1206 domain-containing protein n=1 Tax=Nocardioides imazamoxiresistens TaxID=3231893 RepID=A0ABU3PSN4_9ACTN|nr:DUF1206 domain-containing protein [Nocardioides zeae]MDT9592254.1 DUF1206 domain-containing protein [Nocardioides zeae]